MNKFIFTLILVVAVGSVWYWYDNRGSFVVAEPTPSESEEPVAAQTSLDVADGMYRLNPALSSMTWKGSKPLLDDYFDSGSVGYTEGLVTVADGVVASGAIIVDMASIRASATGGGAGMDRLTQHLTGEDFFDVAQYPTSTFRLTDLRIRDDGTSLVNGDLTIKGVTKPISFVALVSSADGRITMTAEDVQVDRTVWDLTYGSGSFFDNLGDNVIDDIFTVSFTVIGVVDNTTDEDAEGGAPELQ